jgi:hypothetical protein
VTAFRVLVTGSRKITETQAAFVRVILRRECSTALACVRPVVVVQGECPHGRVDLIARRWADAAQGVESEGHPADWETFGKRAGMVRNAEMVALGADICLAFPAPDSRGTWDCLTKAAKAGIHTRIYPLVTAGEPS